MKKKLLLFCIITTINSSSCMEKPDAHGNTALHQLASQDIKDISEIENASIGMKALLLIYEGYAVNAKNKEGETPLHLAAKWGNHPCFALQLLKNGADINAQNNRGDTPLHYCWLGVSMLNIKRVTMSYYLIAQGADIYKSNKDGFTSRNFAAQIHGCDLENLKAMVDKKVPIEDIKRSLSKNN